MRTADLQFARPTWIAQCLMSGGRTPAPMPVLANVLIGLEYDPGLRDLIGYDEFAYMATMRREIAGKPFEAPRKLTDNDVGDVQQYLQHAGIKSISKDIVHQAIDMHARNYPYHPVRDYLRGLLWDGIPRIDRWLIDFASWEDTPYSRKVGRIFLIAMVARVFDPGCKADYMIILEGTQGRLKSTLLRRLAEPWFDDHMPDIGNKDAAIHLRGKWLIEIAEMHTFTKAETTQLKSYLTRQIESYRPPYGRKDVDEPRQCLFAGTTNKDTYLKDETGARRYLPGLCMGRLDADGLTRWRDQMLAEAMHCYFEGELWWPEPAFEQEYMQPQQALRYEGDVWDDLIGPWLADRDEVTLIGIATNVLNYTTLIGQDANGKTPINRFGTADQNRVKSILKSHGFVKSPKRDPKTGRTLFIRPEALRP